MSNIDVIKYMFLFHFFFLIACPTNKKIGNPCETIKEDLIPRIEKKIKDYIDSNESRILASIPRYQPLVDWLKKEDCILDVLPPEAIVETLPAHYSIFLRIKTIKTNSWLRLNIQEGEVKNKFGVKSKINEEAFLFLSLESCPGEDIPFKSYVKSIIELVAKNPQFKDFPIPPELSEDDLLNFYKEEMETPDLRDAFVQFSAANKNFNWFASVQKLKNNKAAFHLCAALAHPSDDVKMQAMKGLREIEDDAVVPYLLKIAKTYSIPEAGSENATLHVLYQREIIKTMNKLTGIEIRFQPGEEIEALHRGLKMWQKN